MPDQQITIRPPSVKRSSRGFAAPAIFTIAVVCGCLPATAQITLNQKAGGYRGIWYMNQPSDDQYVYKYSGGLGTYCAKHQPFAVYCPQVNKTFFCYGGASANDNRQLLHMVSYFDHETKTVPRPTIVLDKQTSDAHDNPVISVDDQGHIWIFSTSHGTSRPSYIHRSKQPYDINQFELIRAVQSDGDSKQPITNFSYMQAWHVSDRGFAFFFTKYASPAKRTICFSSSVDGRTWTRWQKLAAIEDGHYQISGVGRQRIATVFNYHPQGKGLNWRTNLYYLESTDFGQTWLTAVGQKVSLPLNAPLHPSMVFDYASRGLNVYLKDISFDEHDRPVVLFITSQGYQSGPANDPRTWTIARWDGNNWRLSEMTTSDNNYDMGSLWINRASEWRVIGPTESGPQAYNPGGEVAMWGSDDRGQTWQKLADLTGSSPRNHTYVRRPVHAHDGFYALWADGHGRQPSASRLYFCDIQGNVFRLPSKMSADHARPEPVHHPP